MKNAEHNGRIRGGRDESSITEFKIYSISSFSASLVALGQLG